MITVVQAKFVSMIIIGIGSFVVGVAPACFVSRIRYLQQKLLLSCILCFGGGVLFATSILHMLPETRESMINYAELLFSCGFLLLYFIDECVHYFWGSDEHVLQLHQSRYETSGIWNNRNEVDRCRSYSHQTTLARNGISSSWNGTNYGALQYTPNAPSNYNEETFLCHGNHSEPCIDSNTNLMGLLLALTIHAVLEGLAIGLQKALSEVFLLVGAVASHKFVIGFCLGLELAGANNTFLRLILAIFVFSVGSAIGIGIGMLTFKMKNDWTEIAVPLLQGLAGGTLLYVTVSEIMPRERAKWHRNPRRSAGILQLFSMILGFIIIYLLNNYVGT
ncbi:zinc transporter ZIP3-like [Apis laboriosa]|uniref:zinc transporter ZIP3-like n=1 Tax=Apis laboriosa TaxID=183418 RepID=UPI001CC334D0|nr:zinc transporter ZIP3-like [Apis laboriosa]